MSINNTVITPATAAGTFVFEINERQRVTVSQSGLAGAETIALELAQGSDSSPTWLATGIELDASTTLWTQLEGPGKFRLNKGVTAGAAGAYLDGDFTSG